jgi:serine protease
VAGVAALIWAANPGINNDTVESILMDTANRGTLSGQVANWPNAYAAVIRALGDTPPELSNVQVQRTGFTGRNVSFSCDATDAEDGVPQVTWTSDRIPVLGTGTFFGRDDLQYGHYVITCTVRDAAGMQLSQTVQFDLVNAPPTVSIDSPNSGDTYYSGQTAFFKAYTYDLESSATLADAKVVWSSNLQGTLGTGNFLQKELTTVGAHTITITGTDPDGVSSHASVAVTVLPPPPDGVPPTAFIYGFDYDPNSLGDRELDLAGVGQDKEDGPLSGASLAWTLQSATVTWNIPGGTAYGNFPKAILSGIGNFTITLTVTDSSGKTATATQSGVINPLK